jgi:hypothetical protein
LFTPVKYGKKRVTSDFTFGGKRTVASRVSRPKQAREYRIIKITQDPAIGSMVSGRAATPGSAGLQYYSVFLSHCRLNLLHFLNKFKCGSASCGDNTTRHGSICNACFGSHPEGECSLPHARMISDVRLDRERAACNLSIPFPSLVRLQSRTAKSDHV